MIQEYFPKKIEIDFKNKFAVVTMNSIRDLNEFFKKFSEFSEFNYPRFMIQPYFEKNYPDMNRSLHPLVQPGIPMTKVANNFLNPIIDQFQNLRIGKS